MPFSPASIGTEDGEGGVGTSVGKLSAGMSISDRARSQSVLVGGGWWTAYRSVLWMLAWRRRCCSSPRGMPAPVHGVGVTQIMEPDVL
jgi:hypothetical protein